MSVIAASCCTEESFESSSKKPITDDTADETASDMMDSACEAKESFLKLKMRFKRGRAEGGSALSFVEELWAGIRRRASRWFRRPWRV
jgi:hypothetical protein